MLILKEIFPPCSKPITIAYFSLSEARSSIPARLPAFLHSHPGRQAPQWKPVIKGKPWIRTLCRAMDLKETLKNG
jgi:phage-related protein